MTLREIMERARLTQLNPLQLALFPPRLIAWEGDDRKEITMDNVIVQTQLEKVWVSTVDISMNTRMFDTLIEVVIPEGEFANRPYSKTRATKFQFETMVFPSDGDGPIDYGELDCERYNNLDEAKAGHTCMVEKWTELDRKEIS